MTKETELVKMINKYIPNPITGDLPGYEKALLQFIKARDKQLLQEILAELPNREISPAFDERGQAFDDGFMTCLSEMLTLLQSKLEGLK